MLFVLWGFGIFIRISNSNGYVRYCTIGSVYKVNSKVNIKKFIGTKKKWEKCWRLGFQIYI